MLITFCRNENNRYAQDCIDSQGERKKINTGFVKQREKVHVCDCWLNSDIFVSHYPFRGVTSSEQRTFSRCVEKQKLPINVNRLSGVNMQHINIPHSIFNIHTSQSAIRSSGNTESDLGVCVCVYVYVLSPKSFRKSDSPYDGKAFYTDTKTYIAKPTDVSVCNLCHCTYFCTNNMNSLSGSLYALVEFAKHKSLAKAVRVYCLILFSDSHRCANTQNRTLLIQVQFLNTSLKVSLSVNFFLFICVFVLYCGL